MLAMIITQSRVEELEFLEVHSPENQPVSQYKERLAQLSKLQDMNEPTIYISTN